MTTVYTSTASSTATSTGNYVYTGTTSGGTTGTTTIGTGASLSWDYDDISYNPVITSRLLQEGRKYDLPDGSKLEIDDNGNFIINDKDTKVTYKTNNIREFNKFINASDLLEMFIADCGDLGAKQNQILDIPIELFINWLIMEAAIADGDKPPDDVKSLSEIRKTKHCKYCGKFIHNYKYDNNINFCNGLCLDNYNEKIKFL
jgi:hypothetical protein